MADFDPTSILTDQRKAEIVNARLAQWADDAYMHQVSRESILAVNAAADEPLTGKALDALTEREDTAIAQIKTAMVNAVDSVKDVDTEQFESLSKASAALTASREVKPVKPGKG